MQLVTFALMLVLAAVVTMAQERRAVALLTGPGPVRGNVTFTQTTPTSPVMVEGRIENLPAGKHGFHVHEKGDLTGGCVSAGGHFNPENKKHGAPEAAERHVGDLGNIESGSDGVANIAISDAKISLSGEHSILGRGLVLHADADDLGLGGHSDSLTTGHAGARVACGVIGVQSPSGAWPANSAPTTAARGVGASLLMLALAALVFV